MRWTLPLSLAALLVSAPTFGASTPPKPKQQQASQTSNGKSASQRPATARPTARSAAARQSATHQSGGRIRQARYAHPQTPHPGLGGSGSEAANYCGNMIMPAESLREVSRGMSRGHAGLDLMAPHGSPIRAAAAGTVIYAGWYYAYGNMVDIRHADGVVTRYAHMSALGADVGGVVQAGDEIGKVGATGRAHGAHIHFEVRLDGRAVDPKPYLALASCNGTAPREEILEAYAAEPEPRPRNTARRPAPRQTAARTTGTTTRR